MHDSRAQSPNTMQRALSAACRRERLRASLAHDAHALGPLAVTPPAIAQRDQQWSERVRRLLRSRRLLTALGASLMAAGFGHASWVEAKAMLAQVLLQRAWEHTLATGIPARPWPWADTLPVARFEVPRLGVSQIVLSGAGGRSLAFGPSMSGAGARPGEVGNVVLSGHRDTHFGVLRDVRPGDRVWLETRDARHAYVIDSVRVADAREERIDLSTERSLLTLVTCYPFNAINPRGPLRFVVHGHLLASTRKA